MGSPCRSCWEIDKQWAAVMDRCPLTSLFIRNSFYGAFRVPGHLRRRRPPLVVRRHASHHRGAGRDALPRANGSAHSRCRLWHGRGGGLSVPLRRGDRLRRLLTGARVLPGARPDLVGPGVGDGPALSPGYIRSGYLVRRPLPPRCGRLSRRAAGLSTRVAAGRARAVAAARP